MRILIQAGTWYMTGDKVDTPTMSLFDIVDSIILSIGKVYWVPSIGIQSISFP